jgi:hypothetical protein
MANIAEIKAELGVSTLNLNTVVTAAGEKTSWLKHWDNSGRIAVLIHRDTLDAVKANKGVASLGINTQKKQGAKGEYVAKTIVLYKEAEETL